MAESETECAAPGLNTLEPECVTAHSGVSDGHHTHTSLIKTETDLGSTHSGDLIKMESLDSTELGYVTHLHPDQIKTETDDGGYLKAEHISDLRDIICVEIKSDEMKCESSESSVSDLMNPVLDGDGEDFEGQAEPWRCPVETNLSTENEENYTLLSKFEDVTLNGNKNCGNRLSRSVKNVVDGQGLPVVVKPLISNSGKNPSALNSRKRKNIPIGKGELKVDEKSYICTKCGKGLCSKSYLFIHLRNHAGEKPYKCSLCQKGFSSQSCLSRHKVIHTGEKPHRCSDCGKCFSERCYLNTHRSVHTGEKPFKCTLCEKGFSSKSYLFIHQRIHTGEKPYKCTQCEKSFCSQSRVSRHQRIHTGEKPYKCTLCEKFFSSQSYLNRHHRIHTGEKPYTCSDCGKSFSEKGTLNTHRLVHTGEKPYKCTQCVKCFSLKYHLDRHQRIHTGEKPYKCTQCGKCFTLKYHLDRHQRVHADGRSEGHTLHGK